MLIYISEYGSAALVLTGTGVEVVPLDGVTPAVVTEKVAAFQNVVEAATNRVRS